MQPNKIPKEEEKTVPPNEWDKYNPNMKIDSNKNLEMSQKQKKIDENNQKEKAILRK